VLACPLPTITESLAIAEPGPEKLTINVDNPAVFNTSQIFDINTRSKAKEGYDISSLTLDGSLARDNMDLLRVIRAAGNSYDKLTAGYVLFTALGCENSHSMHNKGDGIYYTSMTLTVKQSAFYKIRMNTAGAERVAIYSLSSWALQIYATRFEKNVSGTGAVVVAFNTHEFGKSYIRASSFTENITLGLGVSNVPQDSILVLGSKGIFSSKTLLFQETSQVLQAAGR
jgi:hypothetical protein